MIVKFLTRKTWGISERQGKNRYTVGVTVFDKKVMERLRERQAQVNAGLEYAREHPEISQTELIKKYGIVTKFTNHLGNEETNTVHALIGYDGKYIGLGTMELQTTDDMTTAEKQDLKDRKQKPEMMKQISKHQNKMRAIMRNCFQRVFPKKHELESYWTSNSLHSLRHVFAQAWLARSKFDFKWVSERGHWGGIAILEQAYGKPTAKLQLIKTAKYSETTLAQAEQQAQSKAQEKTAEESTGVTDPKVMAMLEKLTEKMMNTKFETTKEYAEKHPEQVEGAEKVEGVAEPEPESESEGEDEPEGVREA